MPKRTKQIQKKTQAKRKKAGAKKRPRIAQRIQRRRQARDDRTHFRQTRDDVNRLNLQRFRNLPVIAPIPHPAVPVLVEHNSPMMQRRKN